LQNWHADFYEKSGNKRVKQSRN